jgi:antitoxin (DNA-binding transcriptional repressor) of toxin-antitoxin stability system
LRREWLSVNHFANGNATPYGTGLIPGEERVITQNDQPVAGLRALFMKNPKPRFGNCQGKLIILAEDDEHLKDFEEYMP